MSIFRKLHEYSGRTGEPFSGSADPRSAGNGSLMRLAPVPLFFAGDPAQAIQMSGTSSRTTYGTQTAVDACRYLGALIVGALLDAPKDELLSGDYSPVPGYQRAHPLCAEIEAVAKGSFKTKEPPEIRGSGYVLESLEAALWAFGTGNSFRKGCLLAVNLGDDADTTDAVYGQLAGAYYGLDGIPAGWRKRVTRYELIIDLADKIYERAYSAPAAT